MDTAHRGKLVAYLLGYVKWPGRPNRLLCEEVVERVFVSLVTEDNRRLRAFDETRGTLLGYLKSLTRDQLALLFRERGRLARQAGPLPHRPVPDRRAALYPQGVYLEEFLASLPRRLRRYCEIHVLGRPEPTARPISPANARKLTQRLIKKLRAYEDVRPT
jgi:hypothetical protein